MYKRRRSDAPDAVSGHARSASSPGPSPGPLPSFVSRKLTYGPDAGMQDARPSRPPTPVIPRSSFPPLALPLPSEMSTSDRKDEILRWQARIGELQAADDMDVVVKVEDE